MIFNQILDRLQGVEPERREAVIKEFFETCHWTVQEVIEDLSEESKICTDPRLYDVMVLFLNFTYNAPKGFNFALDNFASRIQTRWEKEARKSA